MLNQGASVLLVGETGSGVGLLAAEFAEQFDRAAIATYKASAKNWLLKVAEDLGIDTQTEGEKPKDLNVEQLKEAIQEGCEGVVFVLPEAHRLPNSLRFWLMDCMADGSLIMAIAAHNLKKDLYLELLEVEAEPPTDEAIREIMRLECKRYRLVLSEAKLAQLQPLAGRNPMLARKVIRAEALGLKQEKPEHTQYLDVWPLVMAFICLLGLMKFVGIGTGERSLYIVGGIAMMVGLSLRYAGQIKGARRGLQ